MLSPTDSPRGRLLSRYVLARVTQLDTVDLALFDWDRHNTIYFFAMNADEEIYLRYGGRDPASPLTYLNLDSLARALEQGLELHRVRQASGAPPKPKSQPIVPRDFPLLVERTFARRACVECHLVADFRNQHRQLDGTLDKRRHMYRSPDIKTIGIHLDVPKGLVVAEAEGAVAAAGMRAGDRVRAIEGAPVWTFADLQYRYDQVDREATAIALTVERGGETLDLDVALPRFWWRTDIRWRHWTVDPRAYFESVPLERDEKEALALDPAGFASRVVKIDDARDLLGNHDLEIDDVIYSVDGVERDETVDGVDLFIKLRVEAGEVAALGVIRDGERRETRLKTDKVSFRK